MPTLAEVLRTFPERQFLVNVNVNVNFNVNIKSNDPTEADRLLAYPRSHGIAVDGGQPGGHRRRHGVDRLADLRAIPSKFQGYVITDKVERIKPAVLAND